MSMAYRSTARVCLLILRRDLLIACRRQHDLLNPFVFFLLVTSLFPLAISPQPEQLSGIAAGVLWIAALLASLLALDNLYRADYEDGSLEQWLLSPQSLYFMVLTKNLAHWLVSGLPVVLVSPLLAYMLKLPAESWLSLLLGLLLGTPVLSLLGSIGGALTVGLGSRGPILAVLSLPLSVPVLIFGTLAVQQPGFGTEPAGYLAILGALLLAAITLAPLASLAALRISIN